MVFDDSKKQELINTGLMTAGIVHEIKNPTHFIINFAAICNDLLTELRLTDDEGYREDCLNNLEKNIHIIKSNAERLQLIVKTVLQSEAAQKESVPLHTFIDNQLMLIYHTQRSIDQTFNCQFDKNYDPSISSIFASFSVLVKILQNIIQNAFDALIQSQTAKPLIQIITRNINGTIEIIVKDNGPGVPESISQKVFEPFFTTKSDKGGSGIGLAYVKKLVEEELNGHIFFHSEMGIGTEVGIRFPFITQGSV